MTELKELNLTVEKVGNWLNQCKLKQITPTTLIIGKPSIDWKNLTGEIKPVATILGIEVYIDESLPQNTGYLIDINSYKELGLND